MSESNNNSFFNKENQHLKNRISELEKSLKNMHEIINRSPVVTFVWKNSAGWPVEFVSENVKKHFGYSAKDFLENKLSYIEIIHSDDIKRVTEEVTANSNDTNQLEFVHQPYRIITRNGVIKWVNDVTSIRRTPQGTITHYEGVIYDISEKKQASDELQEIQERFSKIFHNHPTAMQLVNLKTGVRIDVNKSCLELSGYTREEFLRSNALVDNIWTEISDLSEGFKTLLVDRVITNYPGQIKTKSGEIKHILASGAMLDSGDGNLFIGAYTDITEKINLQEQLFQAQKMESVGRLAGGIAHDFNNMLGVILGYTQILTQADNISSQQNQILNQIKGAAERSADLTKKLLTFARKQTIVPKILNINSVIDSMLIMLQRLLSKNIDLQWHPTENIWNVKMDKSQIEQILTNLCINASDAIQETGSITVKTENTFIDENSPTDLTKGHYVVLIVSDTGCGMPEQILDKIFEPFFTLKNEGEGTGLGLATVYGIVKQNNGFIKVKSTPNQGSEFQIFLPSYKPTTLEISETQPISEVMGGSEIILVVEDEPAILEMTSMMLEMLGYTVFKAAIPSKALQIITNYPDEIDLLLSDIVMPEMNGLVLSKKIQKLRPQIKTLLMSGYTKEVIAEYKITNQDLEFIAKPFSIEVLAKKVRDALK